MNKGRQLIYESDESLIYIDESDSQEPRLLKVLRSSAPDLDQILRFNNEYEFTKNLQIEGIRKALARKKDESQYALVLEYVEGSTLEEAFAGKKHSLEEILQVFIQIADALGKLHEKGIIHKDINARNILWNALTKRPIIIDFGISNRIDLVFNNLGNPDTIKGTLTHMSPEQTGRVNRKIDSRSDLYSLGITLFQLLAGKLPYASADSLELVHFHIAKSVPLLHRENPAIPETVSRMVAKLMAKNAEDRYQTAFGLKYDLEKCLAQLQKWHKINDFALGEKDYSRKFQIPQKLYGRYEEVKALLKAFDRVTKGSTELLLVAGYSGVGKSALISEIYKPITRRRGYFIGGKFDQYQRNIPYFAIIQAFTEFCDLLLTEKKEKLAYWRITIQESLGENGRVLLDMVPALENIIGLQPEVPKLEAQEALNRFNMVFRNFIRAIVKPEHPFALFIDDLQWADVASLSLIKLLVSDLRNPYLLVIGAYRNNEVSAGHPLLDMIDAAAKEEAVIQTIELNPLREEHLFQMIKEAMQIDDTSAQELSELVFSKTLGNAFFTIEFLKSLNQQGLVTYNFDQHNWHISMEAIRKRSITSNVVELLVSKIEALPPVTQNVLKVAACIGGLFDLQTLSVIYEKNSKDTLADLWIAIEEGLLIPVGDQYQYVDIIQHDPEFKIEIEFLHDRIQQAAYSLIVKEDCEKRHLQIGRLLLKYRSKKDSGLFDTVNHLNKGSSLIEAEEERYRLAQLNLEAAVMARNSSAFQSALMYIDMAQTLTGVDVWEKNYVFALELFKASAEIEYLNGNFDHSEQLIHLCLEKAQTPVEKSEIYFMLLQNQNNSTRYYDAIDAARQGLKLLDYDFPNSGKEAEALIPAEMGKVIAYFNKHGVAAVLQKPAMTDQRLLAIMQILDNLSPSTYVTGETHLWIIHVLYKINLTITHGLTPQGGYAFNELGIIFFIVNNYPYAYPATETGMLITERFKKDSPRHYCRAGHLHINYSMSWVKHVAESIKLNPYYYQISLDCGELIYAGYTSFYPFYNAYFLGNETLDSLLIRIPGALAYTKSIRHDLAHDSLRALQMVMANLSEKTAAPDSFDLPEMTESAFLTYCTQVNDVYGSTMLHLFKAQSFYLQNNLPAALASLQTVHQLSAVMAGNPVQEPTFRMLYALTLIGSLPEAGEKATGYWQLIEQFRQQLQIWAEQNAANFAHKYLLVEAEIERVKGNTLQAIKHYHHATLSAEKYGFERETGLIHHKAGQFWLSVDNSFYAQPHLSRARYIFEKLGYHRLVTILDTTYKALLAPATRTTATHTHIFNPVTNYTKTITADFGDFDLNSFIKASNTLSEEMVLSDLMEKMLRIVIENAGGQRAVLLQQNFGKWTMVADLNMEEETRAIIGNKALEEVYDIPVSIINYVIRTRAEVRSHQENTQKIFERDEYLQHEKPAAYLCLPLTYKGEVNGILYLEHKTSADAFTTRGLQVLRMLTSQMAVSLENASLYNRQSELNKAYQRFVPHDFIHALGHQSILQVRLGDHIQQDMTVMFCDIRSYSTMAEGMTAEENFKFINAYLKHVGPVIQKNYGFIIHYMGDGFIAIFKDDPEYALYASVQIKQEITKYNEKRVEAGRVPIMLGFGVHTGPVMMGIIGDNDRHDASIISDAVNTSSRLEGLTKIFGASIVLSDHTLKRLQNPDQFQFRHLGRIQVKGKEDILAVYEMFSADEPAIMEKKQRTLDTFNTGLINYFNKRFVEAALSLRKVLDENPMDKTARRYLQNAAYFMVEGAPPDWSGVEQMNEK